MKPRISWTTAEELAVFEKIRDILKDWPDTSFYMAAGKAQGAVLPEERRKQRTSLFTGSPTMSAYLQWSTMTKSGIVLNGDGSGEVKKDKPPVEIEKAPEPEEPLKLTLTLDSLVQDLARLTAEKFKEHLQQYVQEAVSTLASPEILTELVSKSKLPRVLVAPLLASQGKMLIEEFKDVLDLRFVETGTGLGRLSVLKNYDGVLIGMTRFMGHAMEDTLRMNPRYERLDGGMDTLRERLLELAVK